MRERESGMVRVDLEDLVDGDSDKEGGLCKKSSSVFSYQFSRSKWKY